MLVHPCCWLSGGISPIKQHGVERLGDEGTCFVPCTHLCLNPPCQSLQDSPCHPPDLQYITRYNSESNWIWNLLTTDYLEWGEVPLLIDQSQLVHSMSFKCT